MSCDLLSLALPSVRSLLPYQPGKPIEELVREQGLDASNIVKLASNENPLGPSVSAINAMQAAIANVSRYPDANGFALKQALAAEHGVEMNQITLGNGSNDVLVLLSESYLSAGASAVYSQYAFFVYSLITRAAGAVGIEVPASDWGHDLDAMAAAIRPDTRMVFLANPNNPTGTHFDVAAFHRFLSQVPEQVIVVADQAYYEYGEKWVGENNPVSLIERYPNLVVVRTFSKAYGLAGCRLGYAFSHPNIADILNRLRQPFNVNVLAQHAALASLSDSVYLEDSRRLNDKGKVQLTSAFGRMGLDPIPSEGNFICVDMKQDGVVVYEKLLSKGVIVRPLGNYNMPQHLRISIGLADENQRCIEALDGIL